MIGQIHKVQYVFTNFIGVKERPVLIIQDRGRDLEVVYITTKYYEGSIELGKGMYLDGELLLKSYIIPHKRQLYESKLFTEQTYVGTVDRSVVLKVLHYLASEYAESIRRIQG